MLGTWTRAAFKAIMLMIPVFGTNHTSADKDAEDFNGTTPDLSDFQMLNCGKRWSCQDYDIKGMSTSIGGYYLDKNCACDDLCLLLQDCCPDAPHLPSQFEHDSAMKDREVPEGSSPDDGDIYHRYSLNKDMFACISDEGINDFNNVSVVMRCPEYYDDVEVTRLCHDVTDDDLMTRLPVSGRESRVLYRNMFCAMCHEEPYLYWALDVECSSEDSMPYYINSTTIPDVINDPNCQVQYQPPGEDYRWRPCVVDVKDRCTVSFPVDTARGRHIVESCEEETDITQRMVFSTTAVYDNQFCAACNNETSPYISCEPRFPDWISVSVGFNSVGYSFSILLDINTNRGSTTVGQGFDYETVERNESVSCEQGQVFDPFRSTCRPVTCGPGRPHQALDIKQCFALRVGMCFRHFIDNRCRKIQLPADGTLKVTSNRSRSLISTELNNTITDVFVTSECSFIQLNKTEYSLFDNGTLELLGTKTFYNSSQYVFHDEQLYLCVSYTQNHTRTITKEVKTLTFIFSLTETVVSTCGICISLVALAVTMLVYLSVRALRNIPGQNLLSLVCSLFLADLLLLVAPSAEGDLRACAVMAAVMHYFFLAAFLWMNVTAVDVWFTFSKAFVKAGDRGKSSKRFLMYSAYSWLTPLVFVLPAALLQVVNPGSPVNPGYGEGICWLTNKYALLLFFATPLFFLLLLNTVLFVLSARNICRAQRTTARMLGKEEEGKMGIYVRLTVVMGLTWTLGFLAAWIPGNEVLIYCFIIMTTLQGLFIFLSFVCTPKVLAQVRRRTSKASKPTSMHTDHTNVSKSQILSVSSSRRVKTSIG